MLLKFFILFTFLISTPLFAGHRWVVRPHRHHSITTTVRVVRPHGLIDIHCNQKDAKVLVNGVYAGQAREFDGFPGKLTLKPGTYRISIQFGTQVRSHKVRVTAGHELELHAQF